jgi:hypothetical protein
LQAARRRYPEGFGAAVSALYRKREPTLRAAAAACRARAAAVDLPLSWTQQCEDAWGDANLEEVVHTLLAA